MSFSMSGDKKVSMRPSEHNGVEAAAKKMGIDLQFGEASIGGSPNNKENNPKLTIRKEFETGAQATVVDGMPTAKRAETVVSKEGQKHVGDSDKTIGLKVEDNFGAIPLNTGPKLRKIIRKPPISSVKAASGPIATPHTGQGQGQGRE